MLKTPYSGIYIWNLFAIKLTYLIFVALYSVIIQIYLSCVFGMCCDRKEIFNTNKINMVQAFTCTLL